ncbi:hypothetical protein HDU96_002749 [Phlyctochytrium bullatum]|nr:hypothetical protein HDU96_002749 [Phlyctochytrium bullatum]
MKKRSQRFNEADALLPQASSSSKSYDPKKKDRNSPAALLSLSRMVFFTAVASFTFLFMLEKKWIKIPPLFARKGATNAKSIQDGYYVIENAVVHTVDDIQPFATGFVVKDGYFAEVGEGASLAQRHPGAIRVNLKNATVVPGMIDSHAHLMSLGYSLVQVQLQGSTSLDEIRQRLNSYLDAHPDITPESGRWLLGRGWDQNRWGGSEAPFPTTADLDVDPRLASIPILVTRVDGHAVWSNKKALTLAQEKFPPRDQWKTEGGEIVVDANGEPTGIFIDDAMTIPHSVAPPPNESQNVAALDAAVNHMLEHGLTGLHDAGVSMEEIALFKKAIDQNKFPIRNYAMILCLLTCENLPAQLTPYDENHHLTVRSVKLLMDGALGSWGAAMIEPYSDAPNKTGLLRIPKDRINDLIWEVMEQKYQVNVHCIGDLANKLVLDAFEVNHRRWEATHGRGSGRTLRSRIEHSQIMRVEDIPRFGEIGVLPSVQPTHATSDMGYAESRLGSRVKGAYIWRSFLEGKGVPHLPLGSDFPIEHVSPLKGIYSAVTRKWPDGSSPHNTSDGWFANERLTRQQALRGFTISAAYASFQEHILGSISKGKLADFVIYEKNWLSEREVPDAEVQDLKPSAVVVGGQIRFGTL